MAVVVVDIGEHAAPAALSAALVQACSASLAQGSCALGEAADETLVATATVKWADAAERRVEITVVPRRGQPNGHAKTLHFRPVDPRAERWRSVGLTIATLVRELTPAAAQPVEDGARAEGGQPPASSSASPPSTTAGESAASAEPPGGKQEEVPANARESDVEPRPEADPAADTSDAPAPSHRTARRSPRTASWIDVGAVGGPALESGSLRAGGFVALGVAPFAWPFFARFSLSHQVLASGPSGLGARFTALSAGAGVALALKGTELVFEPRALLLVERLGVTLTDEDGRSDDGSQWSPGAGAGAALVWERGWASPALGADVTWRGQPTDIAKRNEVVATVPGVDWSVHAALRFFL